MRSIEALVPDEVRAVLGGAAERVRRGRAGALLDRLGSLRDVVTTRAGSRAEVGAEGEKRVTVDGVSLAYDDEGSGPVIVCLPATGHGARDFAPLRARLKRDHRVIALDWPGHGRSGDDHEPPGIARYAALLAGFLDAIGVERAVLLGNSVGGGAALRFAGDHPTRVRGLVLVNSAGLQAIDRVALTAIHAMVRFFEAGARGAAWFPRAFAAYYQLVLPGEAAREQRARIVGAASDSAPILAKAWASFAEAASDLREVARALPMPVLVAWATGDRINQLARARAAIATIPDVRLETFRGGHCPHLEDLDAFEGAVRRFLAALPA